MSAGKRPGPSCVAYRYWHGPVVGMPLSQIRQGHAARIFLSFGKLTPSVATRANGSPRRPHGEFNLSNMLSYTDWTVTLKGRILVTSDSCHSARVRGLQLLIGRRLLSVKIDERSRCTILAFTRELVLTTEPIPNCRESRPHWLLRPSEPNWSPVVLSGTSSRWLGKNGYD
jgi:hypothetical protein